MERAFVPEKANGFEGEIQYELRGRDGATELDGRGSGTAGPARRRGGRAIPAVTLRTSVPDFVRIAAREAFPPKLLLEGALVIEGDFAARRPPGRDVRRRAADLKPRRQDSTLPRSVGIAQRLRRANWVAAGAFAIGGSLFALGAAEAQLGSGDATTAASIYFAGGLFFSTGGYASLLGAVNASGAGGEAIGRALALVVV